MTTTESTTPTEASGTTDRAGPSSAAERIRIEQHSATGLLWLVGWLFSIGLLELPFWKGVLGVLVWPYYLGSALTGLLP